MARIELELGGLDELMAGINKAQDLLIKLRSTLDAVNITRAALQVEINQPTAGTDG